MLESACIIVGTNGFVWYSPSVSDNGEYILLSDAQCIRQWGTSKGLAELISGPLRETVLDTPATVVLVKSQFIFAIPCKKWP